MANRLLVLDAVLDELRRTSCGGGFLTGQHTSQGFEQTFLVTGLSDVREEAIGGWSAEGDSDDAWPLWAEVEEGQVRWYISLGRQNAWEVWSGPIIIQMEREFRRRMEGVPGVAGLSKKAVLILGLGTVGSKMAEDLGRSGIGSLTMVDPDTVEPENVCRCQFTLDQIGMRKVEALRQTLEEINPSVQVETYAMDVLDWSPEVLAQRLGGVDLVVQATDNLYVPYVLNEAARHTVPAVYVGVYEGGWGGFVVWTAPGLTPCYECVMPPLDDREDEGTRAKAGGVAEWDYTEPGGRVRPMAGLNVDVARVATAASRIVLWLLGRGEPDSRFPLDPSRTALFVGNEPEEVFTEPLQTEWARTTPKEDCWCQESAPSDADVHDVQALIEGVREVDPAEEG